MEGERDDIIRQKDHECGALIDERDQLLVDTDARMLALTATDEQLRRRVHELESALAQAVADPVREKAEAAQLQALAAATEASEAALLRLKKDKRDLLDDLEAQTAQSNDLRRQLAEAEATSSTLYARLKTMSEERDDLVQASDRAAALHSKKAAELENALHATPRHVLEEIASLREATNALKADKEAQEAALAQMEEVHRDRVAALEAARDDLTERLAEVQEGPCAHCYAVADERDQLLNDADSVVNELHARVASLETERDDALKTGHDTSSTLRATVARLEAEAEQLNDKCDAADQRSASLKAQLASLAEARDEAQEAQEVTARALRRRVSELEAAAEVDAHEAEEKLRRIAELEQNQSAVVRTPPRVVRGPSPETVAPVNTPTRTAIEALVDAETAASQRVRDLQIELRSRDDDAFRLRRELEAARADAERARSDAERDCERTMTALRREAAAAKDERVQAEEAHRVTRRRLEEAETARGPQDDVKALLASERIQRLEADLALKTRASEEAVAQASLREQGATVHAHAAKAALAEAGARLQRFATRVQELVDLEWRPAKANPRRRAGPSSARSSGPSTTGPCGPRRVR